LSTPDKVGATPTLVGKSERREGRTFQAIAEGLMADGIPSARGKNRWFPATIKAVTTSDNAAALS
jgi:hypothetical protein